MGRTGYRVLKCEGSLVCMTGTVCEITEGKIEIKWDDGKLSNSDDMNLLVFDNAASGVKHDKITCRCCNAQPLPGIRWKCQQCNEYNICSMCYHDSDHYRNHQFERVDTPQSSSVTVGRRAGLTRVEVRGVFEGARVVCGPDWPHGDKYGEREKFKGEVQKIIDYKGLRRNAVQLKEPYNESFRLGHSGKVDVVCSKDSKAVKRVYIKHLPEFYINNKKSYAKGKKKEGLLSNRFETGSNSSASSSKTVLQLPVTHDVSESLKGEVEYSQTSFMRYILEGDVPSVEQCCVFLLDQNESTKLEWLGSAFHLALEHVQLEIFEVLFRFAAPADYKNQAGDPPIHAALRKLTEEKLKMLLGSGIFAEPLRFSPRICDSRGYNLLHLAVYKGNTEFVLSLLEKFPEMVNLQMTINGFAPLHLAAFWNRKVIAELLMIQVEPRCDVNARNCYDQTPLHLAVAQGHFTLMEMLLERGGDVNSQDEDGNTVINYALLQTVTPVNPVESTTVQGRDPWPNDPTEVIDRCYLCESGPAMALFLPCGHRNTCIDCSKKSKHCTKCSKAVWKSIIPEIDATDDAVYGLD